jgi:hypothetical protein
MTTIRGILLSILLAGSVTASVRAGRPPCKWQDGRAASPRQ